MEKYQTLKKLGSGSFGNVEKAQNIETKEIVAIKKLKKKYGTWEECLQLSEVKALRKITHPSIIKLKEVVRVMNDAYLVFEYVERDLFKFITERKEKGQKLNDDQIRHFTKEITSSLACIHKQGYFHRDLKPENVLISGDLEVKLIDFGIAKEVRSKPPFTDYVSTRWYRAPELLFKFASYSTPVDIFALGCLVAEMYLLKPLFQGNSQMDQISKICSILGSPNQEVWAEGYRQAIKKGINFPQYRELSLPSVLPSCSGDALSFIAECLKWDPSKRFTASQLLEHPFLTKPTLKQEQKLEQKPKPRKSYMEIPSINRKNSPFKQQKKGLDRDDEFEQLLNNFAETKISSAKNISEDDDDW